MTSTASHYFWTCEPNPESEAFARVVFDQEDKPMIEAVQKCMGERFRDGPGHPAGRRGRLRVRRRLMKLRREERFWLGATPREASVVASVTTIGRIDFARVPQLQRALPTQAMTTRTPAASRPAR